MPAWIYPEFPGILFSVEIIGAPCFYTDEDYRRYLDELEEMAEKYECALHAYALMTNHVHLLLTPSREDSAVGWSEEQTPT